MRLAGKSRGELEAELSRAMTRFEREFFGRGPLEIRTYLVDDMVLVRLRGVLTVAEQKLAVLESGQTLIKQMRQELMACKRPLIEEMVQETLGVGLRGLHTDINIQSGERVVVLTLDTCPQVHDDVTDLEK